MRFIAWMYLRMGTHVDVDGSYGAQCVDLVNDYLEHVWGVLALPGNAIDLQRARLPMWTWTPNTPTNRPPTGAIVVWDGPYAPLGLSVYGHTAVSLLSDTRAFISLDQNYPPGTPAHQQRHTYDSVAGWWTPPAPVLDRAS